MRYRRDIDGLRALAVLPVVFFHAAIPGFGGGYVGVDIFFVISGYLITSLIVSDIEKKRFSIISFYERRIRRIFPALFAVLLFSASAASYLFLRAQFLNFAKSVLATTFFVSNMLFYRWSGYFGPSESGIALLHTWSLAVEEQFYIVFPLCLVLLRRRVLFLWLVVGASFALSVWGVARAPTAAFYLAPMRAWELLLGALLAVRAFPQIESRVAQELGAAFGLVLIAISVTAYSRTTPFPGASALLPCCGAALVIYSGSFGSCRVSNLLGARPLVFVGLISYSLYLWHWPLLVFAADWKILQLTQTERMFVVCLSFLAAILSWRFVEMPFRRGKGNVLPQRREVFTAAAGVMACGLAFGLFGWLTGGWPSRIPAAAEEIAAYSEGGLGDCRPSKSADTPNECLYGKTGKTSLVVWGDSHARSLIPLMADLAKRHGTSVGVYTESACPPIIGLDRVGEPNVCSRHNAAVMKAICGNPDIETVVLVGRYTVYLDGFNNDFGPAEEFARPSLLVTDTSGSSITPARRRELFASQLRATVDALRGSGKRVVLVYPIPETGYDIPFTLAKLVRAHADPDAFTRPADYYRRRQDFVFRVLDGLPADIVRIHPERKLCDETRCIVSDRGKPLYEDDNHLSPVGSALIAGLFEPLFRRNGGISGQESGPDVLKTRPIGLRN